MDFLIVFFRDVLDGPLYIAIAIINSILICSCIGYLGEQYLNRKKSQADFNSTYASIGNSNGSNVVQQPVQQSVQQPVQQPVQQQVTYTQQAPVTISQTQVPQQEQVNTMNNQVQ